MTFTGTEERGRPRGEGVVKPAPGACGDGRGPERLHSAQLLWRLAREPLTLRKHVSLQNDLFFA